MNLPKDNGFDDLLAPLPRKGGNGYFESAMSTRFFTNTGCITLLNKFKGIFSHVHVAEFDALAGFFRSSGYFRLREYLRGVRQIRILVGIDVDHSISEAAKKGPSSTSIRRSRRRS